VDGCLADLTPLRDYHQRFKICDYHLKSTSIMRDGVPQRFCQQCGRFHDLSAFDGNRKSCREQLCKHNARRRRRAQIEAQKAKAVEALSGSVAAAGAAVPAVAGGEAAAGDVGRLLASLMQNPSQLHALRLLLGVQTHPALPPLAPFSPEGGAAGEQRSDATADPPTYNMARDIAASRGEWSPAFESDHKVLRVSMKLFNRTPADLPADLKGQVGSWLASAPAAVEGLIRPGCVFLTLLLTLDRATYAAAMAAGLQSLLHHLLHVTGCGFWREGAYAVQLGPEEMAMVAGGKVTAYYKAPRSGASKRAHPTAVAAVPASNTPSPAVESASGSNATNGASTERVYPDLAAVQPLCCVVGEGSCTGKDGSTASAQQSFTLAGSHLDASGCEVVCRVAGAQLKGALKAAAGGATGTADLPVSAALGARSAHRCGVAWLEVQRGAWLSAARPVLLVDDAAIAAEVSQLRQPGCRAVLSSEEVECLVCDLGAVLAHAPAATHKHKVDGSCCHTHDEPLLAGGLPHAVVAHKARQLLVFACDMGWAAVAARVLPLATAQCSCASEVVAAVNQASPVSQRAGSQGVKGLSLLHRVVRSGNVALLQGVLHWGQVAGYKWRADRSGPGGITPLHLAALQDDAHILLALLDHAPAGAFTRLAAYDGITPFQLAFQMGHYTADSLVAVLADEKMLPELKQAPSSGSKGGSKAIKAEGEGGALAGTGRELQPCDVCHCTMPPLLLSIAAACADCGSRMPRLLGLHNAGAAAGDDRGHACAGCATAHARHEHGGLTLQRLVGDADAANNVCGGGADADMAEASHGSGHCDHAHGSVYSITALCQGCHANRVLEVA